MCSGCNERSKVNYIGAHTSTLQYSLIISFYLVSVRHEPSKSKSIRKSICNCFPFFQSIKKKVISQTKEEKPSLSTVVRDRQK